MLKPKLKGYAARAISTNKDEKYKTSIAFMN